MYDYFHRELLKRSFAMADEIRVQVLNEPERRAESQSFMWLFRSGEDGLPTIILYGYCPTKSGDNAAEFLKGYQGYLGTDMDMRVTTKSLGSNGIPAGHISGGISWMLFRKENSTITRSHPCRVFSIVISCSPSGIRSIKSILVIIKNGNGYVSRRENPFWRLFGHGLTS